ncbi:hypothetical protein FACS1894211_02200 [Clostridia bacterium]|nr:hypothetical protein FACS1894211_02200 [Clostridia bacterium]
MKNGRYYVGINYFNGWERPDTGDSKWVIRGEDWRIRYPDRIPALGCFGSPDTMEAEIEVAARFGVDFFQMLWYVQETVRERGAAHLNDCFPHYFAAKNNQKLKFALEFCNHPPFGIEDAGLWARYCEEWAGSLKHEGALRIGGKVLFKVHGLQYFFNQCGGNLDTIKERLRVLRETARKNGVGELLIGAGVMGDAVNENEIAAAACFDYVTTYADFPRGLEPREREYPWEELERHAAEGRHKLAPQMPVPYAPFAMSGWNPRPWAVPGPYYAFPTREQWNHTLTVLKSDLDRNPKMQIVPGAKLFTIYAWNEFGEGGIVAPTLGERTMKLEEIQKVFKSGK